MKNFNFLCAAAGVLLCGALIVSCKKDNGPFDDADSAARLTGVWQRSYRTSKAVSVNATDYIYLAGDGTYKSEKYSEGNYYVYDEGSWNVKGDSLFYFGGSGSFEANLDCFFPNDWWTWSGTNIFDDDFWEYYAEDFWEDYYENFLKNFRFKLNLSAILDPSNLVKDFLGSWASYINDNRPAGQEQYSFDLGFAFEWTPSGDVVCDFSYDDNFSTNLLSRLQEIPHIVIDPSMFAGCWKIDSMACGGGHFNLDEDIYLKLTEDGKATFYFGSPSSLIHISTDWAENGGTSIVIRNDFGLEEIKVLLLTKDKMIVCVDVDGVSTQVELSLC